MSELKVELPPEVLVEKRICQGNASHSDGPMNHKETQPSRSSRLPTTLRALFWDYDFAALSWEDDRDLIIACVLTSGDWDAVTWLRSRVEACVLREWIERHRGGGMSPQRLRFWELMLGLPHRQVNAWLAAEGRQIWDKRVRPRASMRK